MMPLRPLLLNLSASTFAALICAGAAADAATDGPKADAPKVLRYAFEIAETGFDPVQVSDLYSRTVTGNIFDAPLQFAYLASPGTLEPNTAASLPEVSADFRTFTFRIKPGIYFDDDPAFDGRKRELTAADYVYSMKRIYDPRWKCPFYGQFEVDDIVGAKALRDEAVKTGRFDYDREIEGLKTIDRYTFRVVLGRPDPRFANSLADASILGAVAREVVERYGDRIMEHPVGTGAFRLAQWRRSSLIVLERNPNYRAVYYHANPAPDDAASQAIAARFEGRRLPMIDRVEISIIEESQPRWLAFLNGEHDFVARLPLDLAPIAIPGNRPSPLLRRKGVQMERVPDVDVAFATFNMEDPVVGGYAPERVALRRAIGLALDTDEMIRSVYKYQAFPAQSMIQPGTFGYDASLHSEAGEKDAARANALLDMFGYRRGPDGWRTRPDGSPLAITVSSEPDQRSRIVDEIWRKSMAAVGLRFEFKVAKWPENLRFALSGHYEVWRLGLLAAGPNGGDVLRYCYSPAIGSDDISRFTLPEYDRLYREQDQLPDGPQRLVKLRELEKLMIAYMPMKPIVHRYKIDLAYPWVLGYRSWPFIRGWWRYVDIDTARQRATR
jgi:ABC-type transport system substrate-binding protein